MRGASHQPAYLGSCLTVIYVCPISLVDELVLCVPGVIERKEEVALV